VDLLAKDVLDSLPCLPLQISRTAAGLQMEIGQGVRHILELETHEQDFLLGVHRQCRQTIKFVMTGCRHQNCYCGTKGAYLSKRSTKISASSLVHLGGPWRCACIHQCWSCLGLRVSNLVRRSSCSWVSSPKMPFTPFLICLCSSATDTIMVDAQEHCYTR